MAVNRETVVDLAAQLGVKPRALTADIKELAWLWEEAVAALASPTPLQLESVLSVISRSYLRGRNIRMGNCQGWWRHHGKKRTLVRLVVEQVADEQNLFDNLLKAGVGSLEGFHQLIRDRHLALEEARQILEEDRP